MSSDRVRVGIVGAGANCRSRHIPGFAAIPGVEIVAVCNRTPESSARVAREFSIPRVHSDWESLIADPDIDAVLIGTWPYLHCPVTLACLAAGKHVLCEARMAMNAAEAKSMMLARRQRPHLVAQLVPAPFSLHVDGTVVRLIREGYLGDLGSVRVTDHGGGFGDRNAPLHWREDRSKSGQNIMSLGIWYETIMRWVGEAARVAAFGHLFIDERVDAESGERRSVTIPDYLEVSAEMVFGGVAQFSLISAAGLLPRREVVLTGSDGILRFDGQTLYGGQRGDGNLHAIPIPAIASAGWRVEEEFINAIRRRETVHLTTFEAGYRYMVFTDAVARSLEEGAPVDILPGSPPAAAE